MHSRHPAVALQDRCQHSNFPQVMQQIKDKVRVEPELTELTRTPAACLFDHKHLMYLSSFNVLFFLSS